MHRYTAFTFLVSPWIMPRRSICSFPYFVRLNSQSGLSQILVCLCCRIVHILKIIINMESVKEDGSECKFTAVINRRNVFNTWNWQYITKVSQVLCFETQSLPFEALVTAISCGFVHYFVCRIGPLNTLMMFTPTIRAVDDGSFGWDIALQAGMCRVRSPKFSLEFFIGVILPAHDDTGIDSASNRNEYQAYFMLDKEGQCVGLTTLQPSFTDCFEIWDHQTPGTLRAFPGL